MAATLVSALVLVSHPLVGIAILGVVTGLGLGVRALVRLRRCLRTCGGFTLDLGAVQVCVSHSECPPANTQCA